MTPMFLLYWECGVLGSEGGQNRNSKIKMHVKGNFDLLYVMQRRGMVRQHCGVTGDSQKTKK